MKIESIYVRNVKGIKEVRLDHLAGRNLFVIGGENGQGKSSVLDSVLYAIKGKRSMPKKVVREGAKRGEIELVIDCQDDDSTHQETLRVRRTITASGKAELEITGEDGFEAPEPQMILNQFYSHIGFDPLEFSRLKPKEQLEMVKGMVGLDFSELDREREAIYSERRAVGRERDRLKGAYQKMKPVDVPAEIPVVDDLIKQMDEMISANEQRAALEQQRRDEEARVEQHKTEIASLMAHIGYLQKQIEEAEQKILGHEKRQEMALNRSLEAGRQLADHPHQDIDPIRSQISEANQIAEKIRYNDKIEAARDDYEVKRDEYDVMSDRIKAIDEEKSTALAEAKFPIAGLGFDADGVTYHGRSLVNASSAETLKVSVAMAKALNPKLRAFLIRDGSLLDEKSLKQVEKLAAEDDYLILLEVVTSDPDRCAVLMKEGVIE